MEANPPLTERHLADAWAALHQRDAPLQPDANRMAFADPQFMSRRETRGIRFHLEGDRPDRGRAEEGSERPVVGDGSARFAPPEQAATELAQALSSGDD